MTFQIGDRVIWAGVQDPRCAPGFNGVVMQIASNDPNSIKVMWDERGSYTWERAMNLDHVPKVFAEVAPKQMIAKAEANLLDTPNQQGGRVI